MIKVLLFDMGGVLNEVDFKQLNKQLFPNTNHHTRYKFSKKEKRIHKNLDLGKISINNYIEHIQQIAPEKITKQDYIKKLNNHITWNEELLNYIKTINLDCQIFSNNSSLFITPEIKTSLKEIFSQQFYSFEIKRKKPSPKAYKYILDHINYKAEEILFIDDKKENLDEAKKFNIKTHLYTNNQELIQTIKTFL